MNKTYKLLVISVCMVFTAGTAWAEGVSESRAMRVATEFMSQHGRSSASMRLVHKAPMLKAPGVSQQAAYYAFNAPRGGYVIVAGDDRVPSVLGYSDNGTFDPQNVPEAMQHLLEGYAAQIDALSHGAKAAPHLVNGNAIAPLVTAQWDQSEPYNLLFPYIRRMRAYVGCVATAMAQVMYYWKWPVSTTTYIPAYTSDDYKIYMPELPIARFDWDNMQDTYAINDTTSAGALAAAQLSLYCAQSVKMNFTPTGSGALSHHIPIALFTYFGYSRNARYVEHNVYSSLAWEDMLYQELAASRPVLYSGSKAGGGHEFVCDGYDGNGMFHINWGWNGMSNGYFLLNVLDPDTQGAGSASGSYGYIEQQGMVIGIEPGSGTSSDLQVTTNHVEVKSFTETRTSSTYNFSVSQVTHFMNGMSQPISFDYGWGVYDSSNRLLQKLNTSFANTVGPQFFIAADQTLLFGSGRSSGVYRIVPIYSERNRDNWRPCVGSGINHIKFVIQGNKCIVSAQGMEGIGSFLVNDITVTGNMHPNRPVHITLNVTNTGNSRNDLIYMFANGRFVSEAFVDLEKGTTGDVEFQYTSRTSGNVNLTFSLNKDGSDPFTSETIVINPMPAASLSGSVKVLNVANPQRCHILGDKFSVIVTATNNHTTTYNEDITVTLYKCLQGDGYGVPIKTVSRTTSIGPQGTVNLQYDLDNVIDGWKYYATVYYYSEGREKQMAESDTYTIYFDNVPTVGDVNGDGEVNIADVNAIIDFILGRQVSTDVLLAADVDGNGEINIGDVNAVISIILN